MNETWTHNVRDSNFTKNVAYDGGGIYVQKADYLSIYSSRFSFNNASHNGGAIYLITSDGSSYVDWNYFDGKAFTNDDGSVTWQRNSWPGDSYTYLYHVFLNDNLDYFMNATAEQSTATTAVVTVYVPRDANKTTNAKVYISARDADNGTVVFTTIVDDEDSFILHPGTVEVTVENLTKQHSYNITVGFSDNNYRYKETMTNVTIVYIAPGQFKRLQQLIDEFLAGYNGEGIPEYTIPWSFRYDPKNDEGCINISHPIIIHGNGRILDADGYCRVFYVNSTNVTLDNIVFRDGNVFGRDNDTILNGGGVYLDAEDVVINNCRFYNNTANYGAGLYITENATNTTISNCIFNTNNATYNGGAIDCNAPLCNLTNTQFTSNIAGEYGAALCREKGATNGFGYYNTFTSNQAGKAGAALGWMGAKGIYIDTYFFYDNIANERGGAIYVGEGSEDCTIYNSIFEGNRVNDANGVGGAIDSVALNLTINRSSFIENEAFNGGAIFAGNASGNAKIIYSNFTDNMASNNGGAINVEASSTLLNYTIFTNNKATNDGGALYVGGTGRMNDIYYSQFNGNEARLGDGGAINWIASAGHIAYSNFTQNSAVYGGAIYMGGNSSNSSITHVYFINNTASENGGAIDWNSTGGYLSYTVFIGNTGKYGAALCRESNATSGFGVNNTFIANHATIAGAALGWMHAQGITITNYTFINNTAAETGGAIYIGPESHNCKIISSTFTRNHVTSFDGMNYGGAIDCQASNTTVCTSKFYYNYAVSGGAIYISSGSGNTNIYNSVFEYNNATEQGGAIGLRASAVTLNNTRLNYNTAAEGGAVYVGGEGITNYIYYSNFTGNNATKGNGGAINWVASSGHIINSKFFYNNAVYGGGVYMGGNSQNSTIANAVFEFNTAVENGGAIDWNASYGNLSNTEFTGNIANYGAALCREAGAVGGFGTGNGFISNRARIAGAALGWMGSVGININTYFFFNNTADVSGGAIYVGPDSSNCTILNSIFWSNSVTNLTDGIGGAIDCEAENMTTHNTTFRDNKAAYGGAIWIGSESGHSFLDNSTFFNNEAYRDGGAVNLRASSVSLNNSNFHDNTAINGGALYVGGSGLTNNITYSRFTKNHAVGGRGGAIDWVASTGNILYSNFTENDANTGGALYIGGNSEGSEISHVRFDNNTAAGNGGAIDWNATGGKLYHTIFFGNTANYGAALCREANSTGGGGYNNTFELNHARISGAALGWLSAHNITIDTYYFWNNTAEVSGGSIYVGEGSDGCRVINSEFKGGMVRNGRGGDIDWIANDGYVYNSTFYRSTAANGGSIYVAESSNNTQIVNSSFNSCSVLGNGGVMVWYGPNGNLTDVDIIYMAATNGGALYGSAENLTITNSTFGFGTSWMGFEDTSEYKGSGSAIYWFDANNLKISNSDFHDLEAHAHGAGIALINCNGTSLYNVSIHGTIALKNGGGVYCLDSNNLTIEACNFTDTAAAFGGGSLYLYNVNATVKDTSFNHTQAPWSNGGAIYAHANINITNSTFERFEAQHDVGTAIYFESGVSNVNISTFKGVNPIYICKDANSTLTENNITQSAEGMYSVWNDGDLYLSNNTFDNYIYNNGTIWTLTYTKMLNNQTVNGTLGANFTFWANITDDNNNRIISVSTLEMLNEHYNGTMPYNKLIKLVDQQGIFLINGNDSGLKNNIISTGVLQVRSPSKLNITVNQTNQGQLVVITAQVTEKGLFNYSGDVKFVLSNGKINTTAIYANGTAVWTLNDLPQGHYKVTAIYSGDKYHEDAQNTHDFDVYQRDTWIRIVIENVIWPNRAVANITTNGNRTILLSMGGRTERYDISKDGDYENYSVHNGTIIVPFDTVYDPDENNYTMSVVYLGDDYYAYQMNKTTFSVLKQNTTINATSIDIEFWGVEQINVTVNKNATGYIKITIPVRGVNQEYVAIIDNGTAQFNIPNLFGGKYENITVVYNGDVHFNGNYTEINFTVNANTTYYGDVKADNIVYGENATVRVLLPTLAEGNVTVYIDGHEVGNVNVSNGMVILDNIRINGEILSGGTHYVNVTYHGCLDYAARNFTNVEFNVSATPDWKMNLDANENPYGENITVTITFPELIGGKNVTIKIGNYSFVRNITNAQANLTLNNLTAGLYEASATYNGDANYSAKTQLFRVHVVKAQPTVNLTFTDDNVTATVSGINITGNVTFYINGRNYTVNVTGNVAVLENLTIGNNSVVAIYNGDINHYTASSAKNYEIDKLNSTVIIDVSETVYPNTVEITVTVGENQTGFVKITVNGDIYISEINGTTVKFNVTGLKVKEYEVNATYYGDETFKQSINSTKFNVTKANITATVVGLNGTVEENIIFVIDNITEGFHGKVNITVGNLTYQGDIRGFIELYGKLPEGNYTAKVRFFDDNNYNDKNLTVNFTVKRVDPKINVTIRDVTYPNNATADITLSNRANGTVNIYLGETLIGTGDIINGTGSISLNMTQLSAGRKDVRVEFITHDRYNNNATLNATFNVIKATPSITIIRNGTDVIAIVTPALSGNVTFDINGVRFENITVNGNATIKGKLVIGNNTVTVIYNGNENYTECNNVKILEIGKITTDLTVNATSVTVGKTTTINVTMVNVTKGKVLIEINNYNYTVDLTDGFAQLNVTLPVGPYTIRAYYMGDENHTACDNTTSFSVLNKTAPYLNITVTSLNVEIDNNITFTVTTNSTGNLTVKVNGVIVKADANGVYHYNATIAGQYIITAEVNQTAEFFKATNSTTVNVYKHAAELIVNATPEVYVGQTTTINVTMKNNETGKVFVEINGFTYMLNLTQGKANLTIALPVNNYTAKVYYLGDEKYNRTMNVSSQFKVLNKTLPYLNITVDDLTVEVDGEITFAVTTNSTSDITVRVNGEIVYIGGDNKYHFYNVGEIGVYNITAEVTENTCFYSASNYKVVNAVKHNSTINATATSVVYGNVSQITVYVPDAQTGYVRITINATNINVTVEIISGVARFNATGLNVGKYNVTVTYLGNEKYNIKSNNTYFNITKANLTAEVIPFNVTVGENTTFVIDAMDDFKGNVSITVNGTLLYNGTAKAAYIIAQRLVEAGIKNATIVFYGDANYNDAELNRSFTVSRVDPKINVTIADVTYPNNATALISMSNNANGTIEIYHKGIKIANATITNGSAEINLTQLTGGVHEVTVKYITNDKYNYNANTTAKFEVIRAATSVNITISGNNVTASVDPKTTGYITFIINGNNYTRPIDNGEVNLPNALRIGDNSVVAIFEGNENYTSSRAIKTSIGNRTNSTVNVTATTETYGNASEITVNVPIAQGGYVRIVVNGTDIDVIVKIDNGEAKFNATGLDVGRYYVNVTYLGDDTFGISDNHTYFNITKAHFTPDVIAQNVTVEQNTSFIIVVPDDYNGNVSIFVNGVKLYNGTAKIPVAIAQRLLAGDKNATIRFYGDANYNDTEFNRTFTVSRITPEINVTVADVTYPENATVVVNISNSANGTVRLYINNTLKDEYDVINGIAEINLAGLAGGAYNITAEFISSDDYNNNVTSANKLVVNKQTTSLIVNVDNITVVDDASVTITVTNNATGTITVYVDGKATNYTIENNRVEFDLDDLAAGNHSIVAYYIGNENFTSTSASKVFNVAKLNSTINATADQIKVGETAVINITASRYNGTAIVYINNLNYTVRLTDGFGQLNLTGLTNDTYSIKVIYVENDRYKTSGNVSSLVVVKSDSFVQVRTPYYLVAGDDAVIIFTLPGDATGTITVKVNNNYYTAYASNGKANITLQRLHAGYYYINATYNGNEKYSVSFNDTENITVVKHSVEMELFDEGNRTIVIALHENATGNITVKYYHETYNATIHDGIAIVTITNATPGAHNVLVNFTGEGDWNDTAGVLTIHVPKYDSPIKLNETNIMVSEKETITVTLPENATGTVTLEVNGHKYSPVSFTKGVAVFEIYNLTAGDKTFVVSYSGDDNYTANTTYDKFTVSKHNSTVNATSTVINVDDPAIINITGPRGYTGDANVTVDNVTYYVELTDGVGQLTINGLGNGTHNIKVTYLENDKYLSSTNNTATIIVNKLSTAITISVENITYGAVAHIVVNVTGVEFGYVTVKLNNTEKVLTVANGTATWDVTGLGAGNYTINANFTGNYKYNATTASKIFEVRKAEPALTVIVNDVEADHNATIIIYTNMTVSGKIFVKVNGTEYNGTIENGKVEIITNRLPAGSFQVNVTYNGDDNYTAAYDNDSTITVSEGNDYLLNITIVDDDIIVEQNVTIKVDVPLDAEGNVIIYVGSERHVAPIIEHVATLSLNITSEGLYRVNATYGSAKYANKTVYSAFRASKTITPINIEVNDSYVGNITKVVVTIPTDADMNVTIEIDGVKYNSTSKDANVFTFEITGLIAGNKTVTAIYAGDNKYLYNATTANFTVDKVKSFVNVTTKDIKVGQTARINITGPLDYNGIATVEINGYAYSVTLTNGIGHVNVTNLANGTYDIHVTYLENGKYLTSTNDTVKLNVTRIDAGSFFFNVTTKNITVGDLAIINITLPSDAYGNVTIIIGNATVNIVVLNGVGVKGGFTPFGVRGLPVGVYNVTVTYNGNEKYAPATNSTNITVSKVNSTAIESRFIVDDLNNGTVIVYVPLNATGNVTIKIGDRKFNATIDDGKAIVNLTGLAPGTYANATVIYSGDGNYTGAEFNTTIHIRKHLTPIEVADVADIYINGTAIINVTVPAGIKDKVTVEIDGVKYDWKVKVNETTYIFEITGLTAGNKTVTVAYVGDSSYVANATTRQFKVMKLNSFVNVTVDDIKVDKDARINITAPGNFNGVAIVEINGTEYSANITNGNGYVIIKNLASTTYNVNVTLVENGNYLASHNDTESFTVSKWNSTLDVDFDNITLGENAIFTITIPDDAYGNVTITIDGKDPITVAVNGKNNIVYVPGLVVGEYGVTVKYNGNYKYNANATGVMRLNVTPAVPKDGFTVEDLGNRTVVVTVPNATGNVTIKIGDNVYNGTLEGGVAYITLENETPGVKLANVTYHGDANHTSMSVDKTVRIPKELTPISISVESIHVDGTATITVKLPENVTKQAIIEIDGRKEYATVSDGKAVFHITGLTAGHKTVTATYAGDDEYVFNSTTKTFHVYKHSSSVSVNTTDINVGETAVINITAPYYDGYAIVKVNGVNYTAVIRNGFGQVNITRLSNGTYNINVTYLENGKYYSSMNDTVNITVSKLESELTVDFANITLGENAVFTVTVSDYGNLTITIDDETTVVAVKAGSNKIIIPDLKVGTHEVLVKYSGNYKYLENSTEVMHITVNKTMTTPDEFKVNDTGNGTIIITVPENTTGNITVVINGENKTVNITNGTAVINILNITNATPGVNNITIIYSGDGNHTNMTYNATVMIPKWASSVNATAVNITEGFDETITVNVLPVNATGIVMVEIAGKGYYANITSGGNAKVIVSGLKAGNYTAHIKYAGDDYYMESTYTVNFTVAKAIEVKVNDTGNGSVVVIHVPGNNTNGTIIIRINGTNYTGEVINGTAYVNLTNVTPGEHNATIIYKDGNNNTFEYNTTITVPKWDAEIDATAIDIVEGADAIITININPVNATGIVLVDIAGKGYYANITDGTVKVAITGIKAGNYTASIRYLGNDYYKEAVTTASFNVFKLNVNGTGNGTVIEVQVPGNATNGTVIIVINGTNYTANVTNGTAIINLTNVTPGEHNVTIIYIDGNGTESRINTTITIPKWDARINATAVDIVEGADAVITINIDPVNATGIVLIDIAGKGYYANITEGTVKVAISGIKAGNYTASIRYLGNDYYNEAVTTASFNVFKLNVNGTGNGTVIEVQVPGNATNGTVIIVINGTNYTANVTNGTAIVNLTNVTPGDHNATIIYINGNNTSEVNTTITVPKWDAVIDATAVDIIEGADELITINIKPVNATGIVLIDIAGKGYYANITGGTVKVAISGIKVGNYTASIRYLGNDYYNEATTIASFNVFKLNVNGTGNGTVIEVQVPGNATNGTVIIVINGTNYTANVTNGTAIINLTNVTPGDHNATIIYINGNNTSEVNTTITIPKWDARINATAIDIVEGADAVITINIDPVNATGIVLIDIAGKGYYANITDGTVKVAISGIKAGNYTASIRYLGNDYYKEATTIASFNVFKLNVNGTGNGTVIEVKVPGNATNGTVIIVINGTNYTANVTNGTAIINLTNVTPGDHNATIIYINGNNTSEINTTITVPKWDAVIDATAVDIIEGADAIITINIDPVNATGIVLIDIAGKGYYANITDGTVKVAIAGIKAGNYTASVRYLGNNYYNEATTTVSFNVFKLNVNGTGNGTVVEVKVPGNATNGTVIIVINGTNYTANVTNGTAIINLTNVTPGDHNATIIYINGNNTSEVNTTITVPKWDAVIDATAVDIIEGADELITINIKPVNATGIVLIDIAGKGYYANITDGTVKVAISGIKAGNYTASIRYLGNNYYNEATTTASFNVFKLNVNGTGNGTVIEVQVPGNATNGTVIIVINGTNYTANVTNGTAIINLTNVTPGDHNATIIYINGNNTSEINTTITIPKWDARINATAVDIVEGADAVITINIDPVNATGIVLIDIAGKGYYANITDGTVKVAISGIKAGNYTASIRYLGNDYYNEAVTTASFNVFKLNVNGTGNGTVIEVQVPGNATNGTVIIVINGTNYTANVTNGTAIVNLTNVTPGDHNATIIYIDGNGTQSQINTTISIPKWSARINATAVNIVEGLDEVITINVDPTNATGIVLVDIDGKGYYANITDGVAKVTVMGLKAGEYTASIRYLGDKYYNEATTTASFNVLKIDVNSTGNSSVIVIHVPGNETGGNVTVVINGTNYTANVTNGTAVINLTNVTPGTHNATIIYVDGNNNTSVINTTITVPKINAPISAATDNATAGKVTITVELPEDVTGYAIVTIDGNDYGINLTKGAKSVTVPITATGDYTAVVTYLGDDKYLSNSTTVSFHATGVNGSAIIVDVNDAAEGKDIEVQVTIPEGQNGTVTVIVDNNQTTTVPVTGGENNITVPGTTEGKHNVTVIYTDSDGVNTTVTKTITVFNSINAEKNMVRGWNSPYDYKAEFLDAEGHVLKNTDVQFIVNGKTYTVKTDSQGIAYLDADLAVGKYDITIINPLTGAMENATTSIVKRLIDNKDIVMDFDTGKYYTVRAIGDDGNPVGAGEVVGFTVNGVQYLGITDSQGYAKLKIRLNPKNYNIPAQYRAFKVTNKIKVKQTMKLVKKTVKVKKGKKIVLKVKVKLSNGKAVKGKKIVFKFKGKKYKAKTNKKGIAKVTIKKKSVLKKLKKGKSYKFTASYYKNTLKGKVKVKK